MYPKICLIKKKNWFKVSIYLKCIHSCVCTIKVLCADKHMPENKSTALCMDQITLTNYLIIYVDNQTHQKYFQFIFALKRTCVFSTLFILRSYPRSKISCSPVQKTHARKTILYKICRKQKLLFARFFYRRAKVENNHRIEKYSNFIHYHSMSGLWKDVWSCLFILQMFMQNFQISVSGIKLKHNLNFRMNLKSPGTDYCLHQPFKLKNCRVSFLAKRER